jgi:predicted nucleotidyltransferase
MTTLAERLTAEDTAARRALACRAAARALALLRARGIDCRLVGSLATGRFHRWSDVDILILRCRSEQRYAIEGDVEDVMEGLPFHVIYLDEVSHPGLVAKLEREARHDPPSD